MLTDEVNGGFVRIVFRKATNGDDSVNEGVNGPVNEKSKEKSKEKTLDKVYRLISDAYVGRNSVSSIGQNQSLTSLLN